MRYCCKGRLTPSIAASVDPSIHPNNTTTTTAHLRSSSLTYSNMSFRPPHSLLRVEVPALTDIDTSSVENLFGMVSAASSHHPSLAC